MEYEEKVQELSLLLMYLTSWEEKDSVGKGLRFWKGYDWGVIDKLEEEEIIYNSRKAKSAYLTEKGIERAKELVQKYFGKELSHE
jgi:hypothetical protein